MARLSHLERAVLRCAGTAAADVAAALSIDISTVTSTRRRCGRNGDDGLPGGALLPRAAGEQPLDIDRFMRANRGLPG